MLPPGRGRTHGGAVGAREGAPRDAWIAMPARAPEVNRAHDSRWRPLGHPARVPTFAPLPSRRIRAAELAMGPLRPSSAGALGDQDGAFDAVHTTLKLGL